LARLLTVALVFWTVVGCAPPPPRAVSTSATRYAACSALPGDGEIDPQPTCGSAQWAVMSAEVANACAQPSGAVRFCAALAQEIASCKLRLWKVKGCDGAVSVGDIHGAYWHAAIFATSHGGWKFVKFDSGDVL
jgi:hypothetical protein